MRWFTSEIEIDDAVNGLLLSRSCWTLLHTNNQRARHTNKRAPLMPSGLPDYFCST